MLSFSSCINSDILLLVGFCFHLYLLVVVLPSLLNSQNIPRWSYKIKGMLLSSDNSISALSSISEQDNEEGELLEFYMFNLG